MKSLVLPLLIVCMASTPVHAQTVVPENSEITFVSKQMGVPVEGRFRRWQAQVSLDPKKPEAARVAFTIDAASASFGAVEADAEMVKPPWFNAARFPSASFQSVAVRGLGGGRFEVAGKLSIKGQTRDIVVPVALTQAGATATATATASGSFSVKRLDFGIGEGEWADVSLVANDVQVKFRLTLTGMAAL